MEERHFADNGTMRVCRTEVTLSELALTEEPNMLAWSRSECDDQANEHSPDLKLAHEVIEDCALGYKRLVRLYTFGESIPAESLCHYLTAPVLPGSSF